ncbi:hypothetical protein FDW89_02770 [Citrobacter sp. wls830]|nr:hypothetical protein FDW89_02770 [Citrobacter sp. wls830]TKV13040.1 hypothetical protein FDX04_17215 [Citrobacter sp. wls615]
MVSLLVLLTDELIRSQTMLETQLTRGGSLTTEKNQQTINAMNNYQENITRKRLLYSENCILCGGFFGQNSWRRCVAGQQL